AAIGVVKSVVEYGVNFTNLPSTSVGLILRASTEISPAAVVVIALTYLLSITDADPVSPHPHLFIGT
ncbi:MAG: hypothetical protein RR939_12105, partial [Acinetobacter sp.]